MTRQPTPRAAPLSRLLRRDRGLAPKETIILVIALAMPLIALMMLYNNVRGVYGNLLGTGPNLADRRLIEQRRLQITGSISDKPPPLLDLSFVSTGLWAGKSSAPAGPEASQSEAHVPAPGARAPATKEPPAKEKPAKPERSSASAEARKKEMFEVQSGATLAGPVPVEVVSLDISSAHGRSCTGAQGPCDCGGRGAGTAASLVLGAGAATLLEGGLDAVGSRRCTCGASALPKAEDDPAYLALGLDDRFFVPEADKDDVKPPRKRLMEILASSPPGMWTRLEPTAKGIKKWELLKAGDYVLVRQTSRISTDYDGSALPPVGLWDERYKPETAFKLANKDAARTAAAFRDAANRKRLEKALASADSRALEFNQRELYTEQRVEVGARVSLSSRDRYVVVNRALDEVVAKELGLKWGPDSGQHRPSLGGTAIVSDPRSGKAFVAVVADDVPRDSGGQVSAGLREAFAETLKIGGALEDRQDAIDTLYVVHDPAKGGSPIADTAQLADLETIADRQATDILPALTRQIAAFGKGPQ